MATKVGNVRIENTRSAINLQSWSPLRRWSALGNKSAAARPRPAYSLASKIYQILKLITGFFCYSKVHARFEFNFDFFKFQSFLNSQKRMAIGTSGTCRICQLIRHLIIHANLRSSQPIKLILKILRAHFKSRKLKICALNFLQKIIYYEKYIS